MTDITDIQHTLTDDRGRYCAQLRGSDTPAELTYRVANPELVIADRTEVPPALRGHGIAAQLVERLVDDARAGGYRILPTCSYIQAQFRRHPEWADLLHT